MNNLFILDLKGNLVVSARYYCCTIFNSSHRVTVQCVLPSKNKLVLKSACGYVVIIASELLINECILMEAEPITVLSWSLMIWRKKSFQQALFQSALLKAMHARLKSTYFKRILLKRVTGVIFSCIITFDSAGKELQGQIKKWKISYTVFCAILQITRPQRLSFVARKMQVAYREIRFNR